MKEIKTYKTKTLEGGETVNSEIDSRFICKECSMVTKKNGYCANGHKVVSSRALLKEMFFVENDNYRSTFTNNNNVDDSNITEELDELGVLLDALTP
tara:strand:- start:82 stop:372 length:291 start_codon:yes stop_codon:yes gene_type:complete